MNRTKFGASRSPCWRARSRSTTAQAIGIEDVVDGGNTYTWQQVELPGTDLRQRLAVPLLVLRHPDARTIC